MFSKNKVKRLKSESDIKQAYSELQQYVMLNFEFNDLTVEQLYDYHHKGFIDTNVIIPLLMKKVPADDYDGLRNLTEFKFRNEYIDYRQYMIDMIQLDRDESLHINQRKEIGSSLKGNSTMTIDPYVKDNIEYQYSKAMLELNFRLGEMDTIDYELQLAELNNESYAKVFFEPVDGGNSSELSIDVKFNDYFVKELEHHDGIEPKKDEDGNIDKDDVVEQWFHTAIIVLAANMLKETDLDSFRSVSEDHAGIPIIEELEFDDEELNNLNDIERQQIENIQKNGRLYR